MRLHRLALCTLGLGALVSTAAFPQAQVPPMLPQAYSPGVPYLSPSSGSTAYLSSLQRSGLVVLAEDFDAQGNGVQLSVTITIGSSSTALTATGAGFNCPAINAFAAQSNPEYIEVPGAGAQQRP